jgi:hypothetical protein
MTNCLCCGETDAAGLFMAIRVNPPVRRVCNNCAMTHGLALPRNRALLAAHARPARWMRECLPRDLDELRTMKERCLERRQDRAAQDALMDAARQYRADQERERVDVGRRQRWHDAVEPGWQPQQHYHRCTDWRASHMRAGQDADMYAIGDPFYCPCCAAAWSVRNGYADSIRFKWTMCKSCP